MAILSYSWRHNTARYQYFSWSTRYKDFSWIQVEISGGMAGEREGDRRRASFTPNLDLSIQDYLWDQSDANADNFLTEVTWTATSYKRRWKLYLHHRNRTEIAAFDIVHSCCRVSTRYGRRDSGREPDSNSVHVTSRQRYLHSYN